MSIYKDGKFISNSIEIKHGIPIPPERGSANTAMYAAAEKMIVGDSIDLPYSRAPISGNLNRATGFKFTQRKVEGILRVWRIE